MSELCPFQTACGGCPHLGEDVSVREAAKARWVANTLGVTVDRVVGSPRALGYRARIHLVVDREGRTAYRRERSHDLVVVDRCAVARPEVQAVHAALGPAPRGVTGVELRSNGTDVVLACEGARADPDEVGRWTLAAGAVGAALEGKEVGGRARQRLVVAGIEHEVGPRSFFQVNLEVNEVLVALVRDRVLEVGPTRVLDLYAGIGNLGFPIAAAGVPVTAVEAPGPSASDARRTAERLGLQVEVRHEPVERLRAGAVMADVLVVDPPRGGAPGVLEELLMARPRRVVLVSCHPPTLAPDLRGARARGYTVRETVVLDMFPQTRHVETVVVLDRA